MFTGLFAKKKEAGAPACDFSIIRPDGSTLEFNGKLLLESNGTELPEYVSGDPQHHIAIYEIDGGGFAVLVGFRSGQSTTTDGELVSSIDEVDDFLCIFAADQNFNQSTSEEPKLVEQSRRISRQFDQLTTRVVEELRSRRS